MNLKQLWKKHRTAILAVVAVACIFLVNIFSRDLGRNPFAKRERLDTLVQLYTGSQHLYYISEASQRISVADQEQNLLYEITSGNPDRTFSTASAVAEGPDGALYVLDTVRDEGGIQAASQRILRLTSNGTRMEVLFECKAYGEDGEGVCRLDGLCVWDGQVLFAVITDKGAALMEIADGGVRERAVMPFAHSAVDGCVEVTDCAVRQDGEMSVSLMSGDVLTWQGSKWSRVYNARRHDTSEYFSIISEIAYGERDGMLYLCDVGQREVLRISTVPELVNWIETVVARNQFSNSKPSNFAEIPLYTGLTVSNGVISVLSTEYSYDPETDEELFFYKVASVGEENGESFCSDEVGVSSQRKVGRAVANSAAVLLAILALAGLWAAWKALRKIPIEAHVKVQLIMVVTALAVTVSISYMIFETSNARFMETSTANLGNVAYRIAQNMDLRLLEAINSPDAFGSLAFRFFDRDVNEVLKGPLNKDNQMYCVVYKVRSDCIYEAYQSDKNRSLMYPLAGRYSGGVEERIAAENSYDITDLALSEGSYIYALVPVYDDVRNPVAFVEVGTDYGHFTRENDSLYVQVLLLAVMGVIIVMLLLSEAVCGTQAVRELHSSRRQRTVCPPDVIRPLAFLYFVIANFSTAFLPIYGTQLWNDSFPMQAEMAAALPLTAEMVTAAVMAFLCGFLVKRLGVRTICAVGGVLYVGGCLSSAFAGNLWVLIGANAMCGAGSGCLTLALNAWAAGYESEEQQNKGFIHINAAYLAGLNCGTVIGSIIWENFGIQTAFFASAGCALALVVLCLLLIGKVSASTEDEDDGEGSGSLRDLFTPNVIRYFLCISVPYLTCTAFLEYFFPLEAEANGLSATHISMAFMLSGLISIYAGSSLAEPITEKLGPRKATLLASLLYAAALFYLVINPNVMSCYVVVVIFASADSFGLSAQSVYFSSLPEVKKTGQSKALGVNSTVESVVSACGSLIFGAALTLGTQKGIFMIAVVFTVLTLGFMGGGRRRNQTAEAAGETALASLSEEQ